MKKTLLLFTLISLVAFTSCDKFGKEDYDKGEYEKETIKDEFNKEGCFELIYPISFNMPDGSSISGNDKEELWTNIKTWYETNDSEEKPNLNYPVEVLFEDGETKTIENKDDMILLKEYCDKDKEFKCFNLVFPVSFTMPDGSTITGNDKEEIWTGIKTWYDANPNSEEKPNLNYPVDIIFVKDETTQTINDEDEMIAVKKDCFNYKEDCFDLVFPISMLMPDASTVTGNDKEELGLAVKTWYEANPTSEEKPELVFPLSIVFEDGTTQEVANQAELFLAKDGCDEN